MMEVDGRMRKCLLMLISLIVCLLVTACGNSDDQAENKSEMIEMSTEEYDTANEEGSILFSDNALMNQEADEAQESEDVMEKVEVDSIDRKIIYTANLQIEVKNLQKAVQDMESEVTEKGGYIVESNLYGATGGEVKSGTITVRIPQEHFRTFIQLVEEGSSKVVESSISGQDVTEEYVDLESRLKSKRVVEERLLDFMEQAQKTEDLLKISNDLADVQGEIEELLGRMKYLENKVDLATVTIHIVESNVKLSGMDQDDLNTWDKTKQQFLKSINWLLTAFSGIIIFFIGGLPLFVLLGIVCLIVFFVIKRLSRKRRNE